MLTCKETSRLISDSFERKLPFRQRLALRTHLLLCRFCSRYRRQLLLIDLVARQMVAAERSELPEAPGRTLSVEARDRISRSIRRQLN